MVFFSVSTNKSEQHTFETKKNMCNEYAFQSCNSLSIFCCLEKFYLTFYMQSEWKTGSLALFQIIYTVHYNFTHLLLNVILQVKH